MAFFTIAPLSPQKNESHIFKYELKNNESDTRLSKSELASLLVRREMNETCLFV